MHGISDVAPESCAPSRECVERIVALACTAPSADNCQPFRFRWDGRRLDLLHDGTRAANALNLGNAVSLLTLGCVLEAVEIAAGIEGLTARLDPCAPSSTQGAPWAHVTFAVRPDGARGSGAALIDRCTDRRPYAGGDLLHPVFERLAADATSFPHVRIHLRPPSEDLADYVAEVEAQVWNHGPSLHDLMKWFRLSRREAEESRDGMRRESLGIDVVTALVLRLCRDLDAQPVVNRLGFLRVFRRRLRQRILSSAALGCITVDAAIDENVVAAGRVGMRAWLELNQAGFGFQPITFGTVLILAEAAGALPANLPESFRACHRRGQRVLRERFGLGPDETPAWIFRTGVSPRLPAEARNFRLKPAAVFVSTAAGAEPPRA